MITDYTTYADVRAACGLSSDELSDTQLALALYADTLSLAMADVVLPAEEPGPGPLETRYAALKLIVTPTAPQIKLLALTRRFATYVVAHEVYNTLPITAPKTVSDSKTILTRFSSDATFLQAMKNVADTLSAIKFDIENINATSLMGNIDLLRVVNRATDVVTNQ